VLGGNGWQRQQEAAVMSILREIVEEWRGLVEGMAWVGGGNGVGWWK